MKSQLRFIVIVTLFALALCTSTHALEQGHSSSFEEMPSLSDHISEKGQPSADLFLQLITRPDVTDRSDIRTLRSAARGAELSFRQSLSHDPGKIVKWTHFYNDVRLLVHAYQKEYALAPEGVVGAEAKGTTLDRLLDGLLLASVRSGISLEELNVAMLQGAATVETLIAERPLSNMLSLADKELVRFFLRSSIDQFRRRTFLDATRAALQHLNTVGEITASYNSGIYAVLRPTLTRELVGLEKYLADPIFISDPQHILIAEYNNEAICDMFALKYAMETYFLSYNLQESLISSVTALIPGMTPEILQEQLSFASGSSQIPINTLAAYTSVTPQLQLTYFPVSGLADRLAVLGEPPPTPPVFSLFPDPYRALIQMNYDILLCDLITRKEWSMANNAILDIIRPLPLGEQLVVKKAAMVRIKHVRTHLGGVSEDTAAALLTLLQSSLNMRI